MRIASDVFFVSKNGVEIQQLTVHRSSSIPDGEAYQLSVTIQGVSEVSSCLTFDASAESVQSALNALSILSDNGGVSVTKSDKTSGLTGDAHHYKI